MVWKIVFAVLHLISLYFVINNGIAFIQNIKTKDNIIKEEDGKRIMLLMMKNLALFSAGLTLMVTLYVFHFIILG